MEADPLLPVSPDALVERLASLCSKRILTAQIIDPEVWPGQGGAGDAAAAMEQVTLSPRWTGPALIPTLDARVVDLDKMVVARGLPRQVVILPQASGGRVEALQRVFVAMRGHVLRASDESTPGAERVPLPSGVGSGRG